MTNVQNNKFAKLLQDLLTRTGTKSSALAEALQYDVSYISKWQSGRMLPSEKNAPAVSAAIAKCLIGSISGDKRADILQEYGCKDAQELEVIMRDMLVKAYNSSKKFEKKGETHVIPLASALHLAGLAQKRKGLDRVAIADLLSLDHDARLVLAGIVNGHFESADLQSGMHYAMGIDLKSANESECVYNAIFLVHMLTSYSGIDFNLYEFPPAAGKFIYAAKDSYALSSMLFPGGECVSCCEYSAVSDINLLYDKMLNALKQEQLIFKHSDMAAMIEEQTYVRSLLSSNPRWLLGHITEHLLPDGLFFELEQSSKAAPQDELKKLHILSKSALGRGAKVMAYDSALAKLASTGELDFFNTRLTLSVRQRIQFFKYLEELLDDDKIQLKIVYGGFSPDFQHITNPCVFMSDSAYCLRLENGRYEDNLLVLQNMHVKALFDNFYSAIWDGRPDVVEGERKRVKESIRRFRSSVESLMAMA